MANATYRGRMIVNDTDYTGSFVDPNPSGVATDDLNTVGIDGKIFNIAGGGGSSVIPNPSGTPTATLSSIQINGVIYAIEGGGGSSEHYSPYNLTVGISGTSKFEETEE